MSRWPGWFKRPLLPLWNGAHRLAWWGAEWLDALAHRQIERCVVCGRVGVMLLRRRVIPERLIELWGLTPAQAEALRRKESLDCSRCGAKLRGRRLASVVLEVAAGAKRAGSLAEWAVDPGVQSLRILEINRIDGVEQALRGHPGFVATDYEEGGVRGAVNREGVRCEDLMGLTFEDESIDLILSSETLEHVPDLATALAEIRRVLKPGGWHIFTIPRVPGAARTFARARVRADGSIACSVPPMLHHPGGDVGYPVFTEFGDDVEELLAAAGFEVSTRFGPVCDEDLGQVYLCSKLVP